MFDPTERVVYRHRPGGVSSFIEADNRQGSSDEDLAHGDDNVKWMGNSFFRE